MLRALGQEMGAAVPLAVHQTAAQPRRRPQGEEPPDNAPEDEAPAPGGAEVAPGRFLAPHPLMMTGEPDPNAPLPNYHPRVSGSMDMAASAPGDEGRIVRARGNIASLFN